MMLLYQVVPFTELNKVVGLGKPGKEINTLGDIINIAIPVLFTLAGLVLLLYLLWGGFSLMLSRGDPKAMEAAKEKLTNAVIGFVIIFVAFWLVQLLEVVFGIKQFGEIF